MRAMAAATRLDHLAALVVSGPDRVALLQGQSSNDVHRVDAARAQLTSFNSPKGRCYAVAVLAAWDDAHWLIVERSVAEALAKRLRIYVLRSKVTVALAADHALTALPRAALGAEAGDWTAQPRDGGLLVAVPGGRALRLAPRAADHDALADGSPAWRLADQELGLATVEAATSERWVPLWMGLEALGAIDYQKGCYTGQEVVARSHYLGTVKQRTFRLRSAVPAAPGTRIFAGGDQALGEVASAAPCPGAWQLLCVGREAAPDAALRLGAPDGPALVPL
jgi:hypothetical protein